ncbi:MAG: kelch repeat-containing protein [Candidatus Brocadiia bacterium]
MRLPNALTAAALALAAAEAPGGQLPPGRFVRVAEDEVGGHYFSQVIYAPSADVLVSWGTRIHSKPIRAHETQHFFPAQNRWIDAWPEGKDEDWKGNYKSWPGWDICSPAGSFYERDGVAMPRPTSSFYQVCWDGHNRRLLFYVASMTFAYEPRARRWSLLHKRDDQAQPPALLLWGALAYDPVNRQAILFGGGGVDAPDGRPHTWALDVTTDTWRRLELETEPPARCNSRMVYDERRRTLVLFGGDAQDRGLADTWVFDTATQRWEERRPPRGPHPRSGHAMAPLDKSGLVLLVGGVPVAPWREAKALAREVWVYDPEANTWTPLAVEAPECDWASMANIPGTDEVLLVTASRYDHRRATYRFRYDPSLPTGEAEGVPPGTAAYKTERTREWYEAVPPADAAAHGRFLAELPPNRWVEAQPPRSTTGRTWGTAILDTHRGTAMKWGGGHSGYQGTDMAFYDVGRNRFTIDRTPAFTPEPFQRWARRPAGRTFFNQPWARHMRHTCAYDPVRQVGVFTDAGGSAWYEREADRVVKHTWLYDPRERRWLEPIPQPFPGGGTRSPIAVPTPRGVVVYQLGKMYRFVGEPEEPGSWGWEPIEMEGDQRPRQHEHMTIVYDSRRGRLIFLSAEPRGEGWGRGGDGPPRLWFFDPETRRWTPNPRPAPGGVVTREAVYLPDQDAVLAYGPRGKDDPVWTRVYLCAENRWLALEIETPQYIVHETALVYDPGHRVAVLLWPPAFERDIRPHLFRLDAEKLDAPPARRP